MFKYKNLLTRTPQQLYKNSNLYKNLNTHSFSTFRQFSDSLDNFLYRLRYPVYYYLIGANVGVFGLYTLGFIPQGFYQRNFALSQYSMDTHRYHTLVTHGFAHGGLFHLGFNMLSLYFFGKFIENRFGSRSMLGLYMGGVLLGGLFIVLQNSKRRAMNLHLGASSGVASILTFFILNFPNQTILLYFIPVPAWVLGLLIFFQSVMFYDQNGGISNSGHLGGICFGALYHFYLRRRLL